MSNRNGRGIAVFVLPITLALIVLTNIPLLYGYLNQSPGLKFMGIIAGVRDTNFYFMMMMQGDGWSPVLRNYFATGESNAIYHGFFWFLLGKIGHILRVDGLEVYHGARIAITVLFVPASYWFVSRFLSSIAERVAALIMLSFGAGAGWLPMLLYGRAGAPSFVPADVGTPEVSSLFTLMTFPHLSAALILIALCFAFIEASASEEKMWLAAVGGVCGMALGFIHAVNLVVIYATLALFVPASLIFLKDKRAVRSAAIFGALSVWPMAYYLFLMFTRPELLPQAPVRSPALVSYGVGFAPFIILSLIHLRTLVKRRILPRGDLLLICWAVSNFMLLYSYPLLLQEARTVLGLQLPLVILSSRAIFATILPWIEPEWGKSDRPPKRVLATIAAALIIVFTFPSSFYNIFERVSRLKNYPELFSLRLDEYEALRFLRNTEGEDVVLSGEWIGSYVPRLARKRSWLGQYDLPSRDSRMKLAKEFFSEVMPSSSRYDFLQRNNVGFVYHGRDERECGGFEPDGAPFLQRIFKNDSSDIYRFESGEALKKE